MGLLCDLLNLFLNDPAYNINLLSCTSKWYQKVAFIFDHSVHGPTLKIGSAGYIKTLRKEVGFYVDPNHR